MSKQVETVPVAVVEGADTAMATGQGPDVPAVYRGLVAHLVGEAQRQGLPVEAVRVTFAARRSAIKARCEVISQVKSLLITAPEPIRTQHRQPTTKQLIGTLAAPQG